jgi:hypothetical protein
MYALKIKLGKVTRRVSLNADESSFENLQETLKKLFTTELTTDAYAIKYKDDENDLITINTDEELKEAFTLHKEKKFIKLFVFVPPQSEEPECCFAKFVQKARRCAQENGWCNRSGQQGGAPCSWRSKRPLLIGGLLFMLFCRCSFFAFFLIFLGIAACKIARKFRGHCGNNARACRWSLPSPAPSAPVSAPQPVVNNISNSASSSVNLSRSGNTKFEQMLANLEEMGFNDRNANIRALVETRGDLTEAVVRLTTQHTF